MDNQLSYADFRNRFPTNEECLDEVKKLRFPKGISCPQCKKITMHYKLQSRMAYTCKLCRNQVYPLAGTIFEKSTTPLRMWFYAMFLMTHTRSKISVKQLQRELGVTYKTAWRIYQRTKLLMKQNNGDLLSEGMAVKKWVFFNTIEFTVVQKESAE